MPRTGRLVLLFATTPFFACSESAQLPGDTAELVLAVLNDGRNGNLGGITGADELCQNQAQRADRSEPFLAFLATKTRTLRDLVPESVIFSAPVVNTHGEKLFDSWDDLLSTSRWPSGAQLYAFDDKPAQRGSGADPEWYDARSWNGAKSDGSFSDGHNCEDWRSSSSSKNGATGDMDSRRLLGSGNLPCSRTLALVCVGAAKKAGYGPCDSPGASCPADDPCAIDPVCGDDNVCRPTRIQSCADTLACTEDVCDGEGGCEHTIEAGSCLIRGKCYKDGDGDGSSTSCNVCDPVRSQEDWSPAANACRIGASCFEDGATDPTGCQICDPQRNDSEWTARPGPLCKIDDKCYPAGEEQEDGCGICDPTTSAVSWTMIEDRCLIDGKCYTAGTKDPTGCLQCDPQGSPTEWAQITTPLCKIGGKCYAPGDKHPDLCGVCDPTVTAVAWTPTGTDCLIGNTCYPAGAKDSSGCNACDPQVSPSEWTPITSPLCKIGGKCYGPGDKHPEGCAECDPQVSAISWTPKGTDCFISGKCYPPGAKDATGCNECSPTSSKTAWTPITTPLCTIDGSCYAPGTKHPQGCAECDPAANLIGWTPSGSDCFIDDQCYPSGAVDPIGCAECDPGKAVTSWTPIAGCYKKIVLSALNEGHTGALGGLAGADAACQSQATAAGRGGAWKAFLSASTREAVDLISGTSVTMAVVNTRGEQLYASWSAAFASSYWASGKYLYSFDGKRVVAGTGAMPEWISGRGWHGSLADGTVKTGYTCGDWTSELSGDTGAVGELDSRRLVGQYSTNCSATAAVVCVQVGP